MSDILIRDMKLPKNYPYRLTLHSDGRVEDHTGYSGHEHYQAVELPPHGRLGDLDKLYKEANNINYASACDILEEICCADTVLEASNVF